MSTGQPSRIPWSPGSASERDEVRAELEAVVSSTYFSNSKRYPALLRYVVEHTLDGDVTQIKERTLGIEVFGRTADYDTNSDTVVRYTAGEVRRRLSTYYHEHDNTAIQIALPTGSYVPEFLRALDPPRQPVLEPLAEEVTAAPAPAPLTPHPPTTASTSRSLAVYLSIFVALIVIAGIALYANNSRQVAALDRFWSPVIRDHKNPLLVTGGNVFSPNPYSGTETATRSTDYPFVSMQIAAALTRVSGLLQRKGGDVQVIAANSATLSDLRDKPVILVGGYNNDWTVRLTQQLPIRLDATATPGILDTKSNQQWRRDHNQPYSSSDDYAIIARFHDTTTGSVTVLLAGLGRNGTEAAAQFLTDAHYMRDLETRIGHRIGDENIVAVLKISVIQGRTGAPSLVAARTW